MRATCFAVVGAALLLAGCAAPDRDSADTLYYGASGAYADQAAGAEALVAPVAAADLTFLTQAAYSGLAQLQYASLAEALAVEPAVRDFERAITADRTRANEELARVTRELGLTPPTKPDPGREQTAHTLETLAGPRFDQDYVAVQRIELRMAVALFETAETAAHDPRLRAFAADRLPTLRQQLAAVDALARRAVSSAR